MPVLAVYRLESWHEAIRYLNMEDRSISSPLNSPEDYAKLVDVLDKMDAA